MSCHEQTEYIMVSTIANVNSTLDKISSATAAAKRAGIKISTAFHGDLFCCVALESDIDRTIDLNSQNANLKLNSLLKHIYVVTPAEQAMKGAH